MADEKDLEMPKKRGRPKASETASSATSASTVKSTRPKASESATSTTSTRGRPKASDGASSTTTAKTRPKASDGASTTTTKSTRPKASDSATTKSSSTAETVKKTRATSTTSKKADVVAAANESASQASKAKTTAKPRTKTETKSPLSTEKEVKVEPKVETNVKSDIKAEPKVEVKPEIKAEPKTEIKSTAKAEPQVDVAPEIKIEPEVNPQVDMSASKVASKDELNSDVSKQENPQPTKEVNADNKDAFNKSSDAEKAINVNKPETSSQSVDILGSQKDNAKDSKEVDNIDLTVDEDEIKQVKGKKKKKKKGIDGLGSGGSLAIDSDEGDLSSKKQKKKRWWLWLLLLLLLLIGILVYIFRDTLFPEKPIVVVPQGMVLDVKSTGTSAIGVEEFIFKPGDTIEFNNALSVGSERVTENEDGKKEELSPFTMRFRFYIQYTDPVTSEVTTGNLIDIVNASSNASINLVGDWYYWYDLAIPGAAYKKVVDSIHLDDAISNEWQGREVELVLEYQTVSPESKAKLDAVFGAGQYDQAWADLVVEIYNDYV